MRSRPVAVAVAVLVLVVCLSGCARGAATPPTKTFESLPAGWTTSRVGIMVRCLASFGWDLSIEFDGAVDLGSISPEDWARFRKDEEECQQQHPVRPIDGPQLAESYVAELEHRRCLERLGYRASIEPPSESEYVVRYDTPERWFAMGDVQPDTMSADTYESVFTTWPPPAWWQ